MYIGVTIQFAIILVDGITFSLAKTHQSGPALFYRPKDVYEAI